MKIEYTKNTEKMTFSDLDPGDVFRVLLKDTSEKRPLYMKTRVLECRDSGELQEFNAIDLYNNFICYICEKARVSKLAATLVAEE